MPIPSQHSIDHITFNKRKKTFANGFKRKVHDDQNRNKLNIIECARDLPKELDSIAKQYNNRNKVDIQLRQGLHINDLCSQLTDAYIDGTIGIDKFETMPKKERDKLWVEGFDNLFKVMMLPHLKQHAPALKVAENIERFLSLPKGINDARDGKKNLDTRAKNKMKRYKESPRTNFLKAVERVTERKVVGLTNAGKAMRVCVAATIYADVLRRSGRDWRSAYREAMRYAYIKLRKHPDIIQAIVNLN
jgi:hypothetical protein